MLDFMNVMTDKILPRITGDALAPKSFGVGHTIMLQGDHLIEEYRHIIITLAK